MRKKEFDSRGCVGDVTSINGTSMGLNTQKGTGAMKPNMGGGNASPGGTKPMMAPEAPTPMPK